MQHCWKSHIAAHILFTKRRGYSNIKNYSNDQTDVMHLKQLVLILAKSYHKKILGLIWSRVSQKAIFSSIFRRNINLTDYAIAMVICYSLCFMFRICFNIFVFNFRNTWLKSVNFQ